MSDQEDIDVNDEEQDQFPDQAEEQEETNKADNQEDQEDGAEADAEEEDEKEKHPDLPLNETIMSESLLLLCKTGNGLAHAYVRLDAAQKGITDISLLKNYIHLRYIDLSNNNLKDISALNGLTHLLTLKLDSNKLTSAKLDPLPYLQQASFSNNKIKTTEGIAHPKLESLNLNKNEISEIKWFDSDKLPSLQTLELRGNKLTSTKGIKLPTLKNLFIAANLIFKLEDLGELKSIIAIHLRDNKLEKLDGFDERLLSLQYINLRGNLISDYNEIKKLNILPKLRALVLLDTPLTENSDYRLEVLIAVRRLERLDKDEYLEEERNEAEEIYEQRRAKELEDSANPFGSSSQANLLQGDEANLLDADNKLDTDRNDVEE